MSLPTIALDNPETVEPLIADAVRRVVVDKLLSQYDETNCAVAIHRAYEERGAAMDGERWDGQS